MTNRPRYVLDTNAIVSALLVPDSIPARSFFAARRLGEILLSDETVEEIVDVLRRPKFNRYLLPAERDRFVGTLVQNCRLVTPTERIHACRDPRDDKWIELAFAGSAEALVSGDADLLGLSSFRGIPIMAPAQFLASLTDRHET